MPDGRYPNPREDDIVYEDRRISRPDSSLPDWEVPDSSYRPIPIVWFTGALIMQVIAIPVLLALGLGVLGMPRILVAAACLIATISIWQMTWHRGMQQASQAWRLATALMLLATFGLTAAGIYA